MSSQEKRSLQELIRVLNDGVAFYYEAKDEVNNVDFLAVFDHMAAVRENAIARLQPHLVMQTGKPEQGHTTGSTLRQYYTKLLARMRTDRDHTYISQLEELEDKTLAKVTAALREADTPDLIYTLKGILPGLKHCHEEMRALQHSTT